MTEQARPTARQGGRFDLSPVVARASGGSASSSEALLFAGYRGGKRLKTLPCVCGGEVTADHERPAYGVAAHQFTGRHIAWREAQDVE